MAGAGTRTPAILGDPPDSERTASSDCPRPSLPPPRAHDRAAPNVRFRRTCHFCPCRTRRENSQRLAKSSPYAGPAAGAEVARLRKWHACLGLTIISIIMIQLTSINNDDNNDNNNVQLLIIILQHYHNTFDALWLAKRGPARGYAPRTRRRAGGAHV